MTDSPSVRPYGFEDAVNDIMWHVTDKAANAKAPGIFMGVHGEELERRVRRALAKYTNAIMNGESI